jgi:hypothetical protein
MYSYPIRVVEKVVAAVVVRGLVAYVDVIAFPSYFPEDCGNAIYSR